MVLLAIIQGVTEFIPVSSSGHLVIAQGIMDIAEPGVTLEVMLHLGTLFAVFAVFHKDVTGLIKGFLSSLGIIPKGHPYSNLAWMIILASFPAGFAGFLFYSRISALFGEPFFAYLFLIFTGGILISGYFASEGDVNYKSVGPIKAFLLGLSQVLTILPGISRSGTTITAGLFLKLDRDSAARFSFLMSIPAVGGATLYELRNFTAVDSPPSLLIFGILLSFMSGFIAIKILMRVLLSGKFHYFGYYCVLAGSFGLLFLR